MKDDEDLNKNSGNQDGKVMDSYLNGKVSSTWWLDAVRLVGVGERVSQRWLPIF